MDVNIVRQDFTFLSNNQDKIYFDNACNTLRPKQVVDAIVDYYNNHPTCAGRSVYALAETTTGKIEAARTDIAKFFNADHEEIVFTKNTTEGINLVANSLNLQPGDIVLTTDKEHNSNLVPWLKLAQKGIIHKVIKTNPDNTFNLENYKELLTDDVKLVSFGLVSNLDGVSMPAKEIIDLAHKNNSLVLIDGAQAAPHMKIDVKYLDVDFFAFSSHKMLGPSGVGALYGKKGLLDDLQPFLVGGDTVESTTYDSFELKTGPEKFEAGLQNYAGIIGFAEAIRYLEKLGLDNVAKQEKELNVFITNELKELDIVKIIGPEDGGMRGGIFSFYIEGMDSHQAAITLDSAYGIMVRSGQHCVHSWFNSRGITNSIRASFYFYNTTEEAEKFVEAIKKISKLV